MSTINDNIKNASQAVMDWVSGKGYTSCTGTVTGIAVYCNTTCKCTVNNSCALKLCANAFNANASISTTTYPGACCKGTVTGITVNGCAFTVDASTGVASFTGLLPACTTKVYDAQAIIDCEVNPSYLKLDNCDLYICNTVLDKKTFYYSQNTNQLSLINTTSCPTEGYTCNVSMGCYSMLWNTNPCGWRVQAPGFQAYYCPYYPGSGHVMGEWTTHPNGCDFLDVWGKGRAVGECITAFGGGDEGVNIEGTEVIAFASSTFITSNDVVVVASYGTVCSCNSIVVGNNSTILCCSPGSIILGSNALVCGCSPGSIVIGNGSTIRSCCYYNEECQAYCYYGENIVIGHHFLDQSSCAATGITAIGYCPTLANASSPYDWGDPSVMVGSYTCAGGAGVAVGYSARAIQGVAIGAESCAVNESISIGQNSYAYETSVAIGRCTCTSSKCQVAVGNYIDGMDLTPYSCCGRQYWKILCHTRFAENFKKGQPHGQLLIMTIPEDFYTDNTRTYCEHLSPNTCYIRDGVFTMLRYLSGDVRAGKLVNDINCRPVVGGTLISTIGGTDVREGIKPNDTCRGFQGINNGLRGKAFGITMDLKCKSGGCFNNLTLDQICTCIASLGQSCTMYNKVGISSLESCFFKSCVGLLYTESCLIEYYGLEAPMILTY